MATPNKFTNLKSLQVKLNAIGKKTQQEVSKAVQLGAQRIVDNAFARIVNGPKTGRIYDTRFYTDNQGRLRKGKKRSVPHQASAPGEAPAADTGELHQSITYTMPENGPDIWRAEVGANTPYAAVLELGSSKMQPRPFMGPAFDEEKDKVVADIKAAIVRGALAK